MRINRRKIGKYMERAVARAKNTESFSFERVNGYAKKMDLDPVLVAYMMGLRDGADSTAGRFMTMISEFETRQKVNDALHDLKMLMPYEFEEAMRGYYSGSD